MMKTPFLLLLTLLWNASTTPGVFYRVKENVSGTWTKVSDVPSLELTFYPRKGNHTYAVFAVKDGLESVKSNSLTVRVRR